MRKRPNSSVTTIFANLVGRSSVSAITQTPASAVRPFVTTPRIVCALAGTASAISKRKILMRGGSLDERLHLSAHVRGNRQRAPGVERNKRDLVPRAKFFLAADRAAHHELDRRAPELGNRELEPQRVAEVRRAEKLAAGVDDRKADAPLEVHLLERQPDRVAEPVFDHAADHV